MNGEIVEWLETQGAADIDHPGGTLLQHLRRTETLLAAWGATGHAQCVALLHATYGTDGFGPSLLKLDDRRVVRDLAGVDVEADVYLYASCDRAKTYPGLAAGDRRMADRFTGRVLEVGHDRVRQFMELTAANELDVLVHSDRLRALHAPGIAGWLDACADYLSAPAVAALNTFHAKYLST